MPRGEPQSTALTLPEDIRKELLDAQKDSITTPQPLPRVAVMPNAVGLFEFKDTSETAPRFNGVILTNHSSNVLWDHKYGEQGVPEDERFPACSSDDGKFGTPRQGFRHEALGRPADGTERIDCKTCPYNQWNTGNKLVRDRNPKGKAVTNNRRVYILTDMRESPVELTLPSTSISGLDEYLTSLLNRGVPCQAVLTEFSQEKVRRGNNTVATVKYKMLRSLTDEEFQAVMGKRRDYMTLMTPFSASVTSSTGLGGIPIEESEEDEDLPF